MNRINLALVWLGSFERFFAACLLTLHVYYTRSEIVRFLLPPFTSTGSVHTTRFEATTRDYLSAYFWFICLFHV